MTEELKKWADENEERRKQGWHEEVLHELNRHADRMERRLRKFIVKALIAFTVIGLTSGIALAGFGMVLAQLKDTRRDFVYDTCKAQNERHDNTIREFIKLAEDAKKKYPKQAAEIESQIEANKKLIGLLQPKQDCKKLSEVAVGDAQPPPPAITTKGETK